MTYESPRSNHCRIFFFYRLNIIHTISVSFRMKVFHRMTAKPGERKMICDADQSNELLLYHLCCQVPIIINLSLNKKKIYLYINVHLAHSYYMYLQLISLSLRGKATQLVSIAFQLEHKVEILSQ